ncbi:MAG TPA: FtsX-like permease family protein, partial [Blastocatellia bacterium]|nr:FtsX-like permease family protein [Blastocatellia bacterium]
DDATSPAVIIINQALAHRDFSDQDPVGQKLGFGAPNPSWAEVVGVVADVKNDQMATGSQPEVYAPYQQSTFPVMSFAVRSSLSPAVLASEVRQAARAVDRRLPVSDFRSMDQVVANAVSQPRFNMVLLVSFAGIALLLAAAGIYGVMSYIVSQQSHEIGVRVALGARYTNILAGVMARGLKVAVTGAVMGLAAAFAFTRLMTGLLFGVKAVDPLTYGVVPVFLISVAAVACYFPARRGARIDPASALRRE